MKSLDRKREAMTQAFIEAIETAGRWLPDWISDRPRNFITGAPYRGINNVMLPVRQIANDWSSPLFAGKGQIKSAGGRIRDGEMGKASWVFFWGRTKAKLDPITGEELKPARFFPKAYQVWNLDQVEGVKESRIKGTEKSVAGADTVEEAEAMLAGYCAAEGIDVRAGDPAYWHADFITMPGKDAFETTEGYYCAFAHEAVHSTGHASRMDRDLTGWKGGEKYGREELVAQLGAAFIRAELGLGTDTGEARDAAYLASWLRAIKGDPSMLFDAAQAADKAVGYIREAAGVEEPAEVA